MIIAIDFDGTIVEHEFPRVGRPVDGAFEWMRAFQAAGAQLILWTMRSDGPAGSVLLDAVQHCRDHGIEFLGVNCNPGQSSWSSSPKAYAHVYIDDAAFGCPLRPRSHEYGRPFVDWSVVGPAVLEMIKNEKAKAA